MIRQRLHKWLRGITLLGLLLSTFLVPGNAQSPDTPPSAGEVAEVLTSTCSPQVYFDIYHDVGDTAGTYTALAGLVTDELEGTFQEKNQVITEAALANYNVLVIADPEGAFTSDEIEAIARFVAGGGRLVILGEASGVVNTTAVNELLAGVGANIQLNDDYVIDPTDNEAGTEFWPLIHKFAPHPLAAEVSSSALYYGASLNVVIPAVPIATGDDDTYVGVPVVAALEAEGLQDNHGMAGLAGASPSRDAAPADLLTPAPVIMAYNLVGAGSVFVTGDSDMWTDFDYDGDSIIALNEHDNHRLAHNVFDYPRCPAKSCYRILFDETHGWATDIYVGDFTIEQGYSELADLLRGYGHSVDALQDPAALDFATLQPYDVLVLLLPQEYYTPAEKDAIGQFVNQGGRLVTIAEWAAYSTLSRDILNDVHAFLGDGLTHNADYVLDPTDNDGIDYWPIIHTFAPDAVNQGVGAVTQYLGSSIGVQKPAYGTAFGDADTYVSGITSRAVEESSAMPAGPLPARAEKGWMEQIYADRPVEGETNGSSRDVRGSKYVYHGPQDSAAILVYADDFFHLAPNTFLDQALQALGLSYTIHYNGDWAGFVTSLTGSGPWDLVLVGADYTGASDPVLTALNNYVLGGGKLVIDDWYVQSTSGNPLWATLGFAFVSDDTDPPDPVYWWEPAHPFFNTPESVPEFTTPTDRGAFVYGQHVRRLPGFEALAGYTTPGPDPDQAALILGNEGRTVFKGFLDFQYDADLDGDALLDGVELWINLIQSMVRVTVQARSQVGAGDVFAIGDADLWDNYDWDGNGTPSLFEQDNARLAHNVFGFGEVCEECRVALFKDQNPWGLGSHRAQTSQAAPGSAVDESLLDAAGNLPEGVTGAPVGPLAPEALGDIVNSFPAPPGVGFMGLEWIDGYLWASGENSLLYKLNPANGAILETIAVPGVHPCGLAWDGSAYWIADCAADLIVQVDTTGGVVRSFPSPGSGISAGPVGLAWDGTALWDVDFGLDQLHRIDPFTGAVLRTIPAPDTRAAGLAWDGRYLWTNGRDSAMTYKLEPATGAILASFATPPGVGMNNGAGAAFDGIYLWLANYDNQTIYQIDVEHLAPLLEPNEQVLRRWGVPYDIFGSDDMGAVNLQPYCKVIVASQQVHTFYQTLSDQRAWFEDWIRQGGMFELHGAGYYVDDWSGLPMPGGFTSVLVEYANDVSIRDASHPILRIPSTISGAELDGWGYSTHGYLVDLPPKADNIIAHEPSGEPAATEFHLGRGCVLATEQPLEWAWQFRYSRLLENMVLDRRCQPYLVLLPLVVKNAP